MSDWMLESIRALPAVLWMTVGVGLPWALAALPRRDWYDRALVTMVLLAFGPALVTAWMFALGTLGQNTDPDAGETINPVHTTLAEHSGGQNLLRPDLILTGTVLIALVGLLLAYLRYRHSEATTPAARIPLATDERVLIGLIALATVARWFITVWLPFGSWDPLWVYGYQARIYTLVGYIPADIGYYPPFLPLQYAYAQIVAIGGMSDHAARTILPFLQIGSILAVYVLGSRLFNRRTGIIAAALWALYPHFGYWTRVGDLEIPVTFMFTGAAAFFLMAWTANRTALRRQYAILAGLFFGVAMWTKPTAGAFVWGVVLLVVVEFVRVGGMTLRERVRRWWPRFEVAALTGLACLPLGALWYGRNIALGHDPIVFPPSFWLTQAMRSGAEFGWPLLALAVLLAYLTIGPVRPRPNIPALLVGALLIALGVLPTVLDPARMRPLEWLALAAGSGVIAFTLWRYVRAHGLPPLVQVRLGKLTWALLLALPYFVTWFYSYSYHYRLSFAIVPLLLLPTAVLLAIWFQPEQVTGWRFTRRLAYAGVVLLLALPGVAIAVYDEGLGWDWLWTIPPPDDYSEAALLGVRDTIQAHYDETGAYPVVSAPGLQTLPFFFPQADIRIVEAPRQLEAVQDVDYFVNSREGLLTYERSGEGAPFFNPFLASLERENVMTEFAAFTDSAFFYAVFDLHPQERFQTPEIAIPDPNGPVFGDFARYRGSTITTSNLTGGFAIQTFWEALGPAPEDYALYMHLIKLDNPDNPLVISDGPPVATALTHYSTLFWEAGEYVIDERIVFPEVEGGLPPGDDYRLRIGFYHPTTGERVPVTIDGESIGDGYTMGTTFYMPEPE